MRPWVDRIADLRAACRENADRRGRPVRDYLLVDAAILYQQNRQPPPHDEALCASIVDQDRIAVPQVKPFVAWLDGDEAHAQSILTWWGEHFARANCLSLLRSPLPLHLLSQGLRLRTHVRLENEIAAWLRIADTRIMTVAWGVLTEAQRLTLSADIVHWTCTDRDGQLRSLTIAPSDTTATATPNSQIHVTQQQEDALLDAAQADLVMNDLGEEYRALTRSWSASERQTWVTQLIRQASASGPHSLATLVELCDNAAGEALANT